MTKVLGGDFAEFAHFAGITRRTNREHPLNVSCKAVGIKVRGALLPSNVLADTWTLFKRFVVEGTGRRQRLIRLTGTYPPDIDTVLAQTAYEIVQARIHQLHIGESSDSEALEYGREYIRRKLKQAKIKTFKVECDFPALLHDVGKTADFVGETIVIEDWGMEISESGQIILEYDGFDPSDTLLSAND